MKRLLLVLFNYRYLAEFIMIKKICWTVFILFLSLITYAAIFLSNFNGYCKEKGKILTQEELIQIVAGKVYEENPYCCTLADGGFFTESQSERFIDRLFGGYMQYVTMHYPRDYGDDPYYENNVVIDECGKRLNNYGMSESEKNYKLEIESIKHFKQKEEKQNEKHD